jgi:hypothetical protein
MKNLAQDTGYLVIIAAGWPQRFGATVGWATVWPTRAEAEACAERARKYSGWDAQVVEVEVAS